MNSRRIAPYAVLVVALIAALAVSQPPTVARADSPLYQALTSLRSLSNSSFAKVVSWVREGSPTVWVPVQDYQQAEAGIAALPGTERYAVQQWLRGNGRSALYALGVTDNFIGPHRPGADYPSATPTPNPYRQLQFATDSLSGAASSPGDIQILGGFAAARRDGTSIFACVSFQNNAPKTATLVQVSFPIKDANGNTVATLVMDRKGTFSSGIGIHSFQSFADWTGGQTHRGYEQNCIHRNTGGVAAMPILEARFATYAVTRVEYADGTSWNSPGATSP